MFVTYKLFERTMEKNPNKWKYSLKGYGSIYCQTMCIAASCCCFPHFTVFYEIHLCSNLESDLVIVSTFCEKEKKNQSVWGNTCAIGLALKSVNFLYYLFFLSSVVIYKYNITVFIQGGKKKKKVEWSKLCLWTKTMFVLLIEKLSALVFLLLIWWGLLGPSCNGT